VHDDEKYILHRFRPPRPVRRSAPPVRSHLFATGV
jgi:hypothetical protein